MDLSFLTIDQLREVLLCIKIKGDRNKIELLRVTKLDFELVNIISEYITGIKIYSTESAFAALLKNGRVVTWGYALTGGKILGDVQTKLKDVKEIYSTNGAFAALSALGQVITWGDKNAGGDISQVQDELKDQVVQRIYSTDEAFAAVLASGRVVTWGNAHYGGDSDRVQAELKDREIQNIYSTGRAFAALMKNGCVVT
jgi:uncharacterized membrane protein